MTHGGRYRPRAILKLTCAVCGDPFEATRPDAMTCSEACRQERSRASRAGRKRKPNTTPKGAQQK